MRRLSLGQLAILMVLGGGVSTGVCRAQAAAGEQPVANRQAVIQQARNAYYNLRSRGMASFQCDITPDWNLLLADEVKTNPEAAQSALQLLQQLRFQVNLGTDDTVKLTHNDLPGQSKEVNDALAQIYGGMEQMTSGFFDTWKLFMLDSPFPAVNSDYALVDLGPRFRLNYKESDADVSTTMGHDFAIDTLSVSTASFDSSIQPRFNATPEGFVLAGYDATYRSQNAAETTVLSVDMQYARLQGVEMLQTLHLAGTYGGTPFNVSLAFSNCQVTTK